jgi:tetratricopeptide (TPR) repeat protein
MDKEPDWVTQARSAPAAEPEPTPATNLGTSQQEIDDSLAWLENLAAKQGATEGLLLKPEERMDKEPDWVAQARSAPVAEPEPIAGTEPEPEPASADDMPAWLRGLDQEEEQTPQPAADATAMWFKKLEEPELTPAAEPGADDLSAWLQGIDSEEEKAPAVESATPAREASGEFDFLNEIEEASAASPELVVDSASDAPDWLKGIEEESRLHTGSLEAPPAWMRDETGEVVAEPTKIEPTRATDWKPADAKAEAPPQPKPEPAAPPKPKKPAPKPEPKPEPYQEPQTAKSAGTSSMPVDPILSSTRNELSRSNIPGALAGYEKLIKKGRYLDEVIFDLREALYRFPVEVSIWQTLGDAYMRANRLQDALDAYTKAEELLR